MEPIVDLRSDTVTQPTQAMREAMAAERMGKQAGIFVTSGTMGNLIGVLAHCQRGEEAIMGHLGHTFLFEAGGISALGGVFAQTLHNQPDGTLQMDELARAIRGSDIHQPVSRLLILENTHNRCGGTVIGPEYLQQAGDLVHSRGLRLHLDGARIFNAAAALGVPVSALTASADSVTFCLSKGLCAPVGSVICGTGEFIARARRIRKQLGGGMRQAGVLAAAGIVALEEMTGRLAEDHVRAHRLADGLSGLPELEFPLGKPQSNMVFAKLTDEYPLDAKEVAARLKTKGIKVGVVDVKTMRMVTHYWIDDEGIDRTIAAFKAVL